ncbi:MAG: flagellar basal body L-ring protein FlgH [Myxococcota bacterium]|nr:flagellar basal body L-ring protein FlgH [Myxococcota bacterium]
MWRFDRSRALGLLLLLCVGALSGCVENGLRQWVTPFDYQEIPIAESPPPVDGAVWRGDTFSGSFLFFDQKARRVGDLVTVVILEDLRAEGQATTDLARSGQISSSLSSDVGFSDLVLKAFQTVIGWFVDDPGVDVPSGQTVNVLQSQADSSFGGEGRTLRRGSFEAVVTCRIVNVLPGKVFHIRGRRSLLVNHEEQFLTLEALVRSEDISINNTVLSASLAEARLTMDGVGVVDDKQRPGWLARALDWVYPF